MKPFVSLVCSFIIATASARPAQFNNPPQFNQSSPQQQQQDEQPRKIQGGAFTLPDTAEFPYCESDNQCQSRCSNPQEHINNGAKPEDAPYFANNLVGTCNYNGLPGCRCHAVTNQQCANIYICKPDENGCIAKAILVQADDAFCQCPACQQGGGSVGGGLGIGPEVPPGSSSGRLLRM